MEITTWGARGSIAVSGPEYVRFGGDTTCLQVRGPGGSLLVDAGTGIRRAGEGFHAAGARDLHLLFTHAHWDHVLGFPFFRPLHDPEARVEIHGCLGTQTSVRAMLGRAMSAPSFPVALEDLAARLDFADPCRERFEVCDMAVETIPLSHPNGGVGYGIESDGRRVVFLTDNELGHVHPGGRPADDYARFAEGADLLLHDAEFTVEEYGATRGWGHSTWDDALALALRAGVRRFGLWHHNMNRDDDALDGVLSACRARVAAAGSGLEVFAAAQGQRLSL